MPSDAAKARAWRLANPGKAAAAARAYRLAHPEKAREWKRANKEKVAAQKREWRAANKDRTRETDRARREANKEKIAATHLAWARANRERRAAWLREYRKANPERVAAWRRAQEHGNPRARLRTTLRNRLRDALDGQLSTDRMQSLMGCTFDELRFHLELHFQEGMTWENHGRDGWHIDHIIPLSAFDLKDPAQQMAACHYTNLQPLWGHENRAKGGVRRQRAA